MLRIIFSIVFVLLALSGNGLTFANEDDWKKYDYLFNELREKSLQRLSEEQLADIKACLLTGLDKEISNKKLVDECILQYDKYAYFELNAKKSAGSVGSYKFGKIGFIRINTFDGDKNLTLTEIVPILQQFDAEGIRALIIDLRGNSGGFVRPAIDFLNQFVPAQGAPIIELRSRRGEFRESIFYVGWKRGICADWKVAVLIDKQTASAAEIVAGALQNWGGAKVFGLGTRGKGQAQTGFALGENVNGRIYITTERVFFPNGVSYDGVGIIPDVKVSGAKALEKALKYLKAK